MRSCCCFLLGNVRKPIGAVKIGPSAIPAFWREQYKGFDNFSWKEFFDIISRESSLFLKAGFDFRALAMEELRKYRKCVEEA